MEKETHPTSAFPPQPPPYSELPPPRPMASQIPPVPMAVYTTHPYQHTQHHGNCTPDTILQTHVVTQQPGSTVHVVTSSRPFGPYPKTIVCTSCHQTGSSKVFQQPSIRTHILAMSLCILGCWPCVPCVYCTDCCMNIDHHCSNCNAYQGTFMSENDSISRLTSNENKYGHVTEDTWQLLYPTMYQPHHEYQHNPHFAPQPHPQPGMYGPPPPYGPPPVTQQPPNTTVYVVPAQQEQQSSGISTGQALCCGCCVGWCLACSPFDLCCCC